jgi:hypothetical protein
VDFQIEKNRDSEFYSRAIAAWWQGSGIVGRCPSCENPVLFSLDRKEQVLDSAMSGYVVLPDGWHHSAYIVS